MNPLFYFLCLDGHLLLQLNGHYFLTNLRYIKKLLNKLIKNINIFQNDYKYIYNHLLRTLLIVLLNEKF